MDFFNIKSTSIILVLFLMAIKTFAQTDSLILNNGDHIVGEVKDMNKGVLTIETDYSDNDFTIEWEKIKWIKTESYFLISLTNGNRFDGTIYSTEGTKIMILTVDTYEEVESNEIVYLKSIDSDFWDRLSASIDLGYSLTKANNLQQFSVRSNFGYLAKRWLMSANYNNIFSTQDDIENIHRLDANYSFRYFLQRDFYLMTEVTWLSNTEQEIELRTVSNLGIGKYIVRTNQAYWGIQVGGSFNNEEFYQETPTRQSAEGFFGTELSLYDIGDLNLLTKFVAYPSLTESKRWRIDYSFDTKYDLPLDFYIKIGLSLNFDNQPVENASPLDYVVQTSFGWEL